MVLPDTIDLEVTLGDSLVTNTEFVNDPSRRTVARNDIDLEPVKSQRLKRVLLHRHDRLGHVPATGGRLVNPVADVGGLEWPALDRRQR